MAHIFNHRHEWLLRHSVPLTLVSKHIHYSKALHEWDYVKNVFWAAYNKKPPEKIGYQHGSLHAHGHGFFVVCMYFSLGRICVGRVFLCPAPRKYISQVILQYQKTTFFVACTFFKLALKIDTMAFFMPTRQNVSFYTFVFAFILTLVLGKKT